MSNAAKQIALLRAACDHAQKADANWREYAAIAKTPPGEKADAVRAFARAAAETADRLEAEERERLATFERTPLLQATIRWNGRERKIVVAKPDGKIEDPHIPETFYRAIRRNWGMPGDAVIETRESWPVVVVDAQNRIVATIENVI